MSTFASTGSLAGSRSLAVTVTVFWFGAIVTVSVVAYSKRACASMMRVPAVIVIVPAVPAARVKRTLGARAVAADARDAEQRHDPVERAAGGGVDERRVVDRVELGVEPRDFERHRFGERAQHAARPAGR